MKLSELFSRFIDNSDDDDGEECQDSQRQKYKKSMYVCIKNTSFLVYYFLTRPARRFFVGLETHVFQVQ